MFIDYLDIQLYLIASVKGIQLAKRFRCWIATAK